MDHNSPTFSGKSAAYGYSCSNCAQSKRKCIVLTVGGPCQRFVPDPDWREPSHGADHTRCHKTNKECVPAKTVRRSGVRKPASTPQANQLEKRIKAGGPNSAIAQIVNSTDTSLTLVNNPDGSLSHVRGDASTSSSINGGQINAGTPNTSYSKSSSDTPNLDLNLDECEECLNHFREFKLKYFPIVHIPSQMTAAELRKVRPFLWLCILSISTKSTARQKALAQEIRKTVAQVMLMESEKSIDLLVGLIVFLGWVNYHFHGKPFLSVFTHLAISLVFELGLHKPVQAPPPIFNLNSCPIASGIRTMEEHRAALGFFMIISVLSSIVQEIEPFRWTPRMEESLHTLEKEKECPNDEVLVHLVRMQLILEQSKSHRTSSNELSEGQMGLFTDVKAKFFDSSPEDVLLLHLYNNELEIAISSIIFNTNEITPRQSDLLLQASTSANAWLDIFLTIPAIEYTGFTFAIFSQISRCLLTLYRIATISQNSAIFQEENALKTTNPLPLLNQIIDKLVQVPVVSGLDACEQRGGDVFSRSAQLLRSFRSEWETKFDSDGMISGMADESYLMDLFDGFSDDLLYNGWFTEMPSF